MGEMLNEDADVADKFLHVIRERRRAKYGKKTYHSDHHAEKSKKSGSPNAREISEKNLPTRFDADGYLHDLSCRTKIRRKLQAARERYNNMSDSEEDSDDDDDEPKPKGPSLHDRLKDGSLMGSMKTLSRGGTHIENFKDSGKGTPSVATVHSNNESSNGDHNSPSKTMKRVKMKISSVRHLSSISELKHRYKKEAEKQMELLETIRQLRGVNKYDFYQDMDLSSDEELNPVLSKPQKQSMVPKTNEPSLKSTVVASRKTSAKGQKEPPKSTVVLKPIKKENNTVQPKTPNKVKPAVEKENKSGKENDDTKVSNPTVNTSKPNTNDHRVPPTNASPRANGSAKSKKEVKKGSAKNKEIKTTRNDKNAEKKSEKDANDDLLPPEVDGYEDNDLDFERELSPIANQMLTPDRLDTPTTPDFEFAVSTAGCTPEPTPSPSPAPSQAPSPVPTPTPSDGEDNEDSGRYIKIRGSRVDSRWPTGHRLFTKPMRTTYNRQRKCYLTHDKVIPQAAERHVHINNNKRIESKIRKDCFEHDSWRETMIRIAYEKEFEYLKRRSITLFPYKQCPILSSIGSLTSMEKYKGQSHLFYPSDVLIRRTKHVNNYIKSRVVKKGIRSGHKSENDIDSCRLKSGQESNDQGYDSGDNVVDSLHSASPVTQKVLKVTVTRKNHSRKASKRGVKANSRTAVTSKIDTKRAVSAINRTAVTC